MPQPSKTTQNNNARSIDVSAAKRVALPQAETQKAISPRAIWARALMGLFSLAMLLLAAGAVFFFVTRTEKYAVGEHAVQYYAGDVFEVPSAAVLIRNKNETTSLAENGTVLAEELKSTLIYYTDRAEVLVPDAMLYYNPRQNNIRLLPYFTRVFWQESKLMAQNGETAAPLDRGFLYDGKDFYCFLEPVTLSFNDGTFALPALSYVYAPANSETMLFWYDKKETWMELPRTHVQASTKDYTIRLLSDTLEFTDGSWQLLVANPEIMDLLF